MNLPQRLTGHPSTLSRFGEPLKYAPGLHLLVPDTYAWMVPNGSWGETNLGLIDCNGACVMIDTGWDLRSTQEMLDACSGVTERSPIDTIINTHADGEHCWGNQLFKGREIIATHACIHELQTPRPRSLQALWHGSALLQYIPVMGLNHFGHYMREMLRPYDFSKVLITSPNSGFSQSKTLNMRDVEIVITEVSPGHGHGDAVVHLPSRRVAYAGGILSVGVTPVLRVGPLDQLLAGLRLLMGMDVDVIVPGHGPLASATQVQDVINYWDFVHQALRRYFEHGAPADEAATRVACSTDFRRQPWANWDSPERLMTNAFTLYQHWGAPPSDLQEPLAALDILRRQALLAHAMPDATPSVMHPGPELPS